MVLNAADDDGLAFQIRQDAAEVAMQFIAQRFVAEEWPPVFGGKDRVHKDFSEGLRHDGIMWDSVIRFNPFRVDEIGGMIAQGRCCAPTLG